MLVPPGDLGTRVTNEFNYFDANRTRSRVPPVKGITQLLSNLFNDLCMLPKTPRRHLALYLRPDKRHFSSLSHRRLTSPDFIQQKDTAFQTRSHSCDNHRWQYRIHPSIHLQYPFLAYIVVHPHKVFGLPVAVT